MTTVATLDPDASLPAVIPEDPGRAATLDGLGLDHLVATVTTAAAWAR